MRKSTIFGLAAGLALLATAPVMAQEQDEEQIPEFPYEYILTPAPGEGVYDLMSINIAFPEKAVYFLADNQGRVSAATLENLTTGAVYQCKEPTRNTFTTYKSEYDLVFVAEDTQEEFPQAEPITEPGNYLLTVRALCLDADDADTMINPSFFTEAYVIYPNVPYTFTPEPGLSLNEISTISVDFYQNKGVQYYENSKTPVATLTNLATGEEYWSYEPDLNTFAESEGTVYTMTFLNEEDEVVVITEPGTYELSLKYFYVEEDGATYDLPWITANFIVGYPYAYELTPADGEHVDQIDYVVINFTDTKLVDFMPDYRPYVGYLTNMTTGNIYYCTEADFADRYETEGKAWYLYFCNEAGVYGPITEDGVYKLSIRGLVEVPYDEEGTEYTTPLPAIEATYYVGSVTGIAANIVADSYNVYDLNGVKVINNGSVDSLNSLKAGIYVINGKKVILRK